MDTCCPGCSKDIENSRSYVDMTNKTTWCLKCARALFNPAEVRKAIRFARDCRKRASDPMLLIATHISRKGNDSCPVCEVFLEAPGKPIPQLIITTGGFVCGLCGFFLPDLPDMIWDNHGSNWKVAKGTQKSNSIEA